MFAQHIIDEVGREQHLAAALLLTGEAARDQARDQRTIAEGALHQRGFRQPRLEIVTEHVGGEQRVEIELAVADHERHVAEAPHRQRIFIGDEAERPHPRALHAPCQQHAERLVRQPPLEGIADEVMLVAAGKGFDQQFPHRRHN